MELFRVPQIIPYPSDNPYDDEKERLGKKLFHDPRLSRSREMSCASCHQTGFGWGDGRATGLGRNGVILARKVPTLINVAFGRSFFWDGRAKTLEEQALGPISSPMEMDMPLEELSNRVSSIQGYEMMFEKVFPKDGVSLKTIAAAIATYERSLLSYQTPFDRWVSGESDAISEQAQNGFQLFIGKANCVDCHSGWNFTNEGFADVGIRNGDKGRGAVETDIDLEFTFKTPTLREIGKRAPYMHDGSLPDLRAVIDHYESGGGGKSRFLKPLNLEVREKLALEAFLKTLNSH